MAGATFGRVKVWNNVENVTNEDLNAEFDNILNNLDPAGIDDHSVTIAQMKQTTDPGGLGTESQATSTAGEFERLRFKLRQIIGETVWYDTPDISLSEANQQLALPRNRIISGAIRGGGSNQAAFLDPDGATNAVTLLATATDFVIRIDSNEVTVTSDVTLSGLLLAPSANNTALVNEPDIASRTFTELMGEQDSVINIDAAGSEITALVGKYAAFLNGSEIFTAFVESSTVLTRCRRGFFDDSTIAPLVRETLANDGSLTLLKLSWLFLKSDSTLDVTFNTPVYSAVEPTSPATGDYWFDQTNNTWKKRGASVFAAADAHLVGVCVQNTTNTIGARAFEFFAAYKPLNEMHLELESTTIVDLNGFGNRINVAGIEYAFEYEGPTWNMTSDLESGVSEGASTLYMLYVTDDGAFKISDIYPYERRDLRGFYHPYNPWRCVGFTFNDGSSDLTNAGGLIDNTEVFINTPNGYGSGNTRIRKFTVLTVNDGGELTYVSSSTNGDSFICNKTGYYHAEYTDVATGGNSAIGFSVSAPIASLSSTITTVTYAQGRRTFNNTPSANTRGATVGLFKLFVGDILRAHSDTSANGTNDEEYVRVIKVDSRGILQ